MAELRFLGAMMHGTIRIDGRLGVVDQHWLRLFFATENALSIRYIKVVGVFDRHDILFNFERSPFFIVGPNGTGKSTSLKILQYILTAQWSRLLELPFNSIEAALGERSIFIERADFSYIDRMRTYILRFARRQSPRRGPMLVPEEWEIARNLMMREIPNAPPSLRAVPPSFVEQVSVNYENVAILSNFVERETRGRVLYFPTYRRIERDLRELLEAEDDDLLDEPTLTPKIAARFKDSGEVIGFGGQDIRALLGDIASKIEVEARRALNEHSVRFLEALSTDKTGVNKHARNLIGSEASTNKLLDRISASAASPINIQAIRDSIAALREKTSKTKRGRFSSQEEMLMFYVGELIKANEKIDTLAKPLAHFSSLISKYLAPVKSSMLREADNRVIILDRSGNEIEFDQLSSGEKQILAFFAFLTLGNGSSPKYILIDEPELSLSVSWQKTLIQDISQASGALFVVSATHSPFIFGNFSLDNVVSLGDL